MYYLKKQKTHAVVDEETNTEFVSFAYWPLVKPVTCRYDCVGKHAGRFLPKYLRAISFRNLRHHSAEQ